MGLFDAFKKKEEPKQAIFRLPPEKVRFSEEMIRSAIEKGNPIGLGCYCLFWADMDEERKAAIRKNKWFPEGLEPLYVCHSKSNTRLGFVMSRDNVIYGDPDFKFPDGRLVFADLANYEYYKRTLVMTDGSKCSFSSNGTGADWLDYFFKALAKLAYGVERTPGAPATPEAAQVAMEKNSIRRSPHFYLPEELPPYLLAKLQRLLPDLPLDEVRGVCDDPNCHEGLLVITGKRVIEKTAYGIREFYFDEWDYLRTKLDKEYIHCSYFQKLGQKEVRGENCIYTEHALFFETEELVDYHLALSHSNMYFHRMRTEGVTREKAEFCYRVGSMVQQYLRRKPRYLLAENARALQETLEADLAAGRMDKVACDYRLLTWNTSPGLSLRYWAYYSFMWEFWKPLSAVTVQRMFYYTTVLERNEYIDEIKFFNGGTELWNYLNSGFYESSLIDRRNELARRVNACLPENSGLREVPVLEGYALDYYMAEMR